MINHSIKPFYEKLRNTYIDLKKSPTRDERIALQHYISNLYGVLNEMGDHSDMENSDVPYGGKKGFDRFWDYTHFLRKKMEKQFESDQEFHFQYMREVILEVEKDMNFICSQKYSKDPDCSRKELFDILYSFFQGIGLENFFEYYYRNKKITSTENKRGYGIGSVIYNPVRGDVDLFSYRIKNNVLSMQTIAHELGHAYDYTQYPLDPKTYNQYFYASFYGEVISRLFERLFLHFLINNGIMINSAKAAFINFEVLNYIYHLETFVISELENDEILDFDFLRFDDKEMAERLKRDLPNPYDAIDVIERLEDENLSDAFNYVYGDIISMFLSKEVEEVGFPNEMLEYFMSKRHELFSEGFLRECGFGPKNYTDLFHEEVKILLK